MSPTKIEWTEETWNPVTGCDRVSPGCDHCYAERIATRFGRPFLGAVDLHEDRQEAPLRWRRPRRCFVNSVSDLFHPAVPREFIAEVFAVMAAAREHTFQVLTKRPQRMASILGGGDEGIGLEPLVGNYCARRIGPEQTAELPWTWPLPNVWLGVSVENQTYADLRIPHLLATPAAVRFLSVEPLLGPVDLTRSWVTDGPAGFDWVIVGGESGPGARPMHPAWARTVRDECVSAGVPFFFKQWGEWRPWTSMSFTPLKDTWLIRNGDGEHTPRTAVLMAEHYGYDSVRYLDLIDRGHPGWARIERVGKKRAGRDLDGRTWDEYPA